MNFAQTSLCCDMGMIIFDLHCYGGCQRPKTLQPAHTLAVLLTKRKKSILNVHQQMRSVIAFSLHISHSRTKTARLDVQFLIFIHKVFFAVYHNKCVKKKVISLEFQNVEISNFLGNLFIILQDKMFCRTTCIELILKNAEYAYTGNGRQIGLNCEFMFCD